MNQEKNIKQELIPEFSSGSSTHAVTQQQSSKTLKQVQGLSNKNKIGFTLIELLVVVLIIGILAAIALPQYQKAVDKSGFVQIWNTAQALGKAQEIYYLDHGHYASSLRELDIDVSQYANNIVLQSCSSGNLPNSAYVYHPKLPRVFLLWGYQHQCASSKTWANKKACYARKDDKRGNSLCAVMTGKPVRTLAENGTCNSGAHCHYNF